MSGGDTLGVGECSEASSVVADAVASFSVESSAEPQFAMAARPTPSDVTSDQPEVPQRGQSPFKLLLSDSSPWRVSALIDQLSGRHRIDIVGWAGEAKEGSNDRDFGTKETAIEVSILSHDS